MNDDSTIKQLLNMADNIVKCATASAEDVKALHFASGAVELDPSEVSRIDAVFDEARDLVAGQRAQVDQKYSNISINVFQ